MTALSGVHITCGYAGQIQSARAFTLGLLGKLAWSQTMSAAGTTTNSAPPASDATGDPVVQVRSSIDVFVTADPSPDALMGPRFFVPAGERVEFYVNPGDKIAWIAA